LSKGTGAAFWLITFFVVLTLVLSAFGVPPQTSPAKKKALVVWGGDMHEPKQCVDLFAPWLTEQGFEVEVSPTLDSYLDAEKMKALSLIVQSGTGHWCMSRSMAFRAECGTAMPSLRRPRSKTA
jgi:hypothetical protein